MTQSAFEYVKVEPAEFYGSEPLEFQVCLHCRTVYFMMLDQPKTVCSVCALLDSSTQVMEIAKNVVRLLDRVTDK